MNGNAPLDHHTALIYVMVLCSAVDGDMSDREMMLIGDIVNKLPVFRDYNAENLVAAAEGCAEFLNGEEGLDTVLGFVGEALPPKLIETAYAIACEIVAADNEATQEELRLLEIIRHRLGVERLTAAAIERGIAALNRVL